MAVSSDGPVGCSGMAKASEIGGSAFPTDGVNYSLRNSQSRWIVGAFTNRQQPAKNTGRRRWCSVAPPMTKLAFLED